jgi:hypothetical protein
MTTDTMSFPANDPYRLPSFGAFTVTASVFAASASRSVI